MGEKDEIAGYNEATRRFRSSLHVDGEKSDEWLSKLVAWAGKCVITADYAISN